MISNENGDIIDSVAQKIIAIKISLNRKCVKCITVAFSLHWLKVINQAIDVLLFLACGFLQILILKCNKPFILILSHIRDAKVAIAERSCLSNYRICRRDRLGIHRSRRRIIQI